MQGMEQMPKPLLTKLYHKQKGSEYVVGAP